MNSESAGKLSLEELRKKNLPEQEKQAVQTQPQIQPIVIQCALPEATEQLNRSLETLEWYMKKQTEVLQEIRNNIPGWAQVERIEESLKRIENQLSQVGKEKEKSSLLSKIRLPNFPDISFSPAMIFISLLVLILFTAWYSLDKLLNGFSQMLR